MNERIDHAAEARKHITEWMGVDFHAGIAQVHATLALVEQQRTANLIAIWGASGVDGWIMDAVAEKLFDVANRTIREGAGL